MAISNNSLHTTIYNTLLACFGCNFSVTTSESPTTEVAAPANSSGDLAPFRSRPHAQRWKNDDFYSGVVAAIGPDWIEIRKDNKLARRFLTDGTFVGGDPNGPPARPRFRYRVVDLRVGDVVRLRIATDGADDVCGEIEIRRRPGGKIPMDPGEAWPDSGRHHQYQAEQDWEENGIPIPAKYLVCGRYEWTNPPYPPIAPQPREVKP